MLISILAVDISVSMKASQGKIMLSSSGPHRQVYQVMKTPRSIHFSSVSLRIKVQSAFFRAQFTRQLYIGSLDSSLRRSRSFINIHKNEDINDIFSFIRSSRVYSGLKRPSREAPKKNFFAKLPIYLIPVKRVNQDHLHSVIQ